MFEPVATARHWAVACCTFTIEQEDVVQWLIWALPALVIGLAIGAGIGILIYKKSVQSQIRQIEAEARLQLEVVLSPPMQRSRTIAGSGLPACLKLCYARRTIRQLAFH
jgi:hypothetical protein